MIKWIKDLIQWFRLSRSGKIRLKILKTVDSLNDEDLNAVKDFIQRIQTCRKRFNG
jgi:hypothetical protein